MTLLSLYPDQKTLVDDYRNVFEKLKFLNPKESETTIVSKECDDDIDDEGEIKTYVDVSGRKKEKDMNLLSDSYALEFLEWDKWLGMEMATETLINFTELEITAHCLYEMTFCGYGEEYCIYSYI